uniref:Uncharacterized protein n=1 Tax=Moniliophthora roreri TaxID=221103 RepID=A0A0W0FPP8_MONRR
MSITTNLRFLMTVLAVFSTFAVLQYGTPLREAVDKHILPPLEIPINKTLSISLIGWHARALANPHPNPDTFTLKRNNIDIFASSISMFDPNGLTLALFRDDEAHTVVIDALGHVLVMSDEDYDRFTSLAQSIAHNKAIPSFESWGIDHGGVTCLPGEYWYVRDARDRKFGFRSYGASGFSRTERKLKERIGRFEEIPEVLHGLMNLTQEALEDGFAVRDTPVSIRKVWVAFYPELSPESWRNKDEL